MNNEFKKDIKLDVRLTGKKDLDDTFSELVKMIKANDSLIQKIKELREVQSNAAKKELEDTKKSIDANLEKLKTLRQLYDAQLKENKAIEDEERAIEHAAKAREKYYAIQKDRFDAQKNRGEFFTSGLWQGGHPLRNLWAQYNPVSILRRQYNKNINMAQGAFNSQQEASKAYDARMAEKAFYDKQARDAYAKAEQMQKKAAEAEARSEKYAQMETDLSTASRAMRYGATHEERVSGSARRSEILSQGLNMAQIRQMRRQEKELSEFFKRQSGQLVETGKVNEAAAAQSGDAALVATEGAAASGKAMGSAAGGAAAAAAAIVAILAIVVLLKKAVDELKTLSKIAHMSLSIKDTMHDIQQKMSNILSPTTGAASYSAGTSLFTNRYGRELQMKYGLSSGQAYAFNIASNMLNIKDEEDIMYMNPNQRNVLLDIMKRQEAWYNKMESSGMLERIQLAQLDLELFKQDMANKFLLWFSENKDTIMSILKGLFSALKWVVELIGKIMTFFNIQSSDYGSGSTMLSDTLGSQYNSYRTVNVNSTFNATGVISNQEALENWYDNTYGAQNYRNTVNAII